MRNAPAYEVRNLHKVYRSPEVVANDGISFTVEPGEAFGLLGPNGAGKSTLVRQLVGLMTPSSGEIKLFGEALNNRRVGRTVAYLPQGTMTLGEFRVSEAIEWTAVLRGCGKSTARGEADELIEVLELGDLRDRQLRKLSGGQRRLTQIAMTLVGRLPVLILDEPTADIDPALRARIWELISGRARAGSAIVLVTHDVAEAEHVLNRVAILDSGKVAALGTPSELKARLSHRTRVEVALSQDATVTPQEVASTMASDARIRDRRVSAWVPADEAIRVLEKLMSSYGPENLEDAHLVTPTLEDVYLDTGGRSFHESETS
ncbi:MAG: type transport system ATP-binding protein [Actinomycetota bacterium]|jgi:ABC-2 type transport system ATP-binding protein|nr:type transport system ATP-binding protein [Actinomycetota bacterium]